jgi:hypothetical protein
VLLACYVGTEKCAQDLEGGLVEYIVIACVIDIGLMIGDISNVPAYQKVVLVPELLKW